MSTLQTAETDLYAGVWQTLEHYGDVAPGEHYLPIFLDCVKGEQGFGFSRGHVLDAGTGSGKGALALRGAGFRVTLCDLTDTGLVEEARALPFTAACLWQDLRGLTPFGGAFDWTYCCDVLEHVPPQLTMLACEQMLRVSRKGLFLGVSLVPDVNGVWVGRPLHQTVQSFCWWRDNLKELGTVVDARDLHGNATFYVRPR
jgi:SAM-dependent methyltransferase